MIIYAISSSSLGSRFTAEVQEAFGKAKLKNIEACLASEPPENQEYFESLARMKAACQAGIVNSVSVHMPFYGCGLKWDPSCLDESIRQDVVRRISAMVRENALLFQGGNMTLHSSNEPPLDEHPQRIEQCRRSLRELLPLAEELDFSINVEFLPRTCVGNSEDELLQLVAGFPEKYVGICLDVNHIMDRYQDLPQMIRRLAPRIKSMHICDYDGLDEMHWFPWQGIIPWDEVMAAIREIDHDVVLISETMNQLGTKVSHVAHPYFGLRQTEKAFFFLENCESFIAAEKDFAIPGNN